MFNIREGRVKKGGINSKPLTPPPPPPKGQGGNFKIKKKYKDFEKYAEQLKLKKEFDDYYLRVRIMWGLSIKESKRIISILFHRFPALRGLWEEEIVNILNGGRFPICLSLGDESRKRDFEDKAREIIDRLFCNKEE